MTRREKEVDTNNKNLEEERERKRKNRPAGNAERRAGDDSPEELQRKLK